MNGQVRWYLHDGESLVAELDGNGSPVLEYVYYPGIDRPHSVRQGGAVHYFTADATGNVTGLVDAAGNLRNWYRYAPYGTLESSAGDLANRLLFTAREYDADIRLYYHRARYYDPHAGRFVSEDPIGIAGGTNLYAYAGNDPVNSADPLGLGPCSDGGGGGSDKWTILLSIGRGSGGSLSCETLDPVVIIGEPDGPPHGNQGPEPGIQVPDSPEGPGPGPGGPAAGTPPRPQAPTPQQKLEACKAAQFTLLANVGLDLLTVASGGTFLYGKVVMHGVAGQVRAGVITASQAHRAFAAGMELRDLGVRGLVAGQIGRVGNLWADVGSPSVGLSTVARMIPGVGTYMAYKDYARACE